MGLNISWILNIFLKKDNLFENGGNKFENKLKELLGSEFNQLKAIYRQGLEDPAIINLLKKKLDTVPSQSERKKIDFQIIQNILQDDNTRTLIFSITEISLRNLEEIVVNFPVFDKNLFNSLFKFMSDKFKTENNKARELFDSFIEEFIDKINDLFITLQFISVFRDKVDLGELIQETDEIEYRSHMKDWVLKFADLIEGPLKDALLFLLKLKYIDFNKDLSYLKRENVQIREVLDRLGLDLIFAHYRNAIFHHMVSFIQEPEIMDKKITFIYYEKREPKRIILTLEEYYNEFFKIVMFMFTFYLVVFKIFVSVAPDSEQIIDKIIEFFDKYLELILNSGSYNEFLSI